VAAPSYEPLTPSMLVRRFLLPTLFVIAIFVATFWGGGDAPTEATSPPADDRSGQMAREMVVLEGQTMGTTFTVKVVAELTGEQQQALSGTVSAVLATVDAQMSTWRPDSELSVFNASPSTEPTPVSAGTMAVMRRAAAVWRQSSGAFDPTVGPLVQRWGFGSDGRSETPPTDAELSEMLGQVGFEKLSLVETPPSLTKALPGLQVDLSAVAKGWGVDQVFEAVGALGYPDRLVEIGGEVRVQGTNPSGVPWRVAVETPDSQPRTLQRVLALHNEAMATSGDYRNYVERDGVRISHTIDPRTGRPITHRLASVSVLHEECALADAWATALNVLGPEEGPRVAEAAGLAAYFLVREDAGLVREDPGALGGVAASGGKAGEDVGQFRVVVTPALAAGGRLDP
jgi:FAD:protein FMN transferase